MKTPSRSRPFRPRATVSAGVPALALVALLATVGGDVFAETTTLRYSGPDFEGRKSFQLEWSAKSNATYLVQSATSLTPTGTWQTVDAVTPTNGTGQYEIKGRSIPENSVEFFRLILPQPQIFAVEPAIAPPNVPVTLYVLGQCFQSNDVMRVGGVVPGGAVLSAAVSSVNMAAQPPGWQRVELMRDGLVLSFFDVFFGDASTAPELVLQGPPELPPAAPCKMDSQGHVTVLKSSGPGDCRAKARKTSRHLDETIPCKYETVKYALWGGGGDCDDSDPAVVPFSGEVRLQAVDLTVEGRGLDFVWARTYHSRPRQTQGSTFGERWTHSYDVNIQPLGGDIVIHDGTGRADTFKLQTNGTYTCPEFFREGTLSNDTFTLTFADGGRFIFYPFRFGAQGIASLTQIIDRNGNTLSLNYDTSNRLAQVVDDLGRTNLISYNTAGRIADVTDFSGRVVRYEYDVRGDLTACVSPAVTGTPNGNDFPGGKTNSYTYSSGYSNETENHLLLSVIDATGQTTSQFVYQHNQTDWEFLRCVSAQGGANPPTQFRYFPHVVNPASHFAATRCIVNGPEGNVTEYFYDARNRCVKLLEFTGRATPGVPVTDTVNRPTGKLRAADPDYFETQWAWNNDSLRISTKEPTKLEFPNLRFVYQSDFDPAPPARKRADLRVVRELASSPVDLDGDGVGDVTERSWHFEYDPRFGTGEGRKYFIHAIHAGGLRAYNPTKGYLVGDTAVFNGTVWQKVDNSEAPVQGSRTRINELENVLKNIGILGRNGNVGINELLPFAVLHAGNGIKDIQVGEVCDDGNTDSGDGFVTAATDPRGNVTTGSFDPNGNLTAVIKKHISNVKYESFAYNPHGQLTTITNAADANGYRRVDTFSYYASGSQAGYVQSITIDEGGVHLTSSFECDARGNLTRCVDPRGSDWLFTYNALDQCVRRTTPNTSFGSLVRCATDFSCDANDNLVQVSTEVRDAAGTLTGSKTDRFQYDSLHRLTEVALAVDADHALTNRFTYDGNGRCVQALGGDAVSGADPHQTVAFQYDERGLLFREIAAPGSTDQSTTQYDYDPNECVTRVSEGLEGTPSITTMAYDGFAGFGSSPQIQAKMGSKAKAWMVNNFTSHPARLAQITDPMGNVTTFNYDANDNLKVVRHFGETNDVPGSADNIRLAETRYEYDGLDRRRSARNAFYHLATQALIGDGENTTMFAYAPNGQCTSVTDDLGRATTFDYDTAGRVVTVRVPGDKTIMACLRDRAGNITQTTQTDTSDLGGPPQVFAVTNVFDPLNRCVSTTDNVGNNETWQFDSLGRVTAQFNPKEYKRTFAYDLLGRCTLAVVDLDGDGLTDFAKDITEQSTWSSSNGRLLATTDSHGNTTSYGYDSLGNCTTVTHADGTQQKLVWSPRSNLVREEDANGSVITNIYDLNDNVIHRDIAANTAAGVSAATTFETFAYDGLGRLTGHHDDDCDGVMDYDSLGNCVRETLNGLATTSTHDALGNRLSLTYPGGRAVTCAYDVLDQVTSVSSSTGGLPPTTLATFAYAGPGRLARTTHANGVRTDVAWNGLVSPPNAPGDFGWQQVSRVNHTRVGDRFLVDERTFQHDRNQNTSSRARTPGEIVPGETITLTYDPADRLVDSIVTSNSTVVGFATYGLDRMGNRTYIKRPFCAGNYSLDATLPPGDFQMNQYTATPCDVRTYDANGNLTSAGPDPTSPVNYTYDCLDRLVTVTDTGVPVATYAYDALGRRVAKTVNASTPAVTTTFLYDGDSVIEERSGGAVTATYVGIKIEIGAAGYKTSEDLVAAFTGIGQPQYYHCDDLGNVLAITDAKGAVVERYDYEDYGRPQFLGADGSPLTGSDGLPVTASPAGNPFLFHGMRWDEELLFFFGHSERSGLRWDTDPYAEDSLSYYDPKTGRATRGKVKDVRGNGTGFAGNNPWSGGGGSSGGLLLKKEEGGRHTPFHNKDRPQFFERGDKPTASQFGILIDSMVNIVEDRYLLGLRSTVGNPPWPGGSPHAMKKGTVKFFNDAKGFGRVAGGGHSYSVYSTQKGAR